MGPRGRRAGFSLIEAAIVLVIIGVLVAFASPFQQTAVDEARGTVTRAHLRNALLAQLTYYSQHQTFTNDRTRLLAIDPSLRLGDEGMPGSIYIAISASSASAAICMFAEGSTGEWQTLYYSTATDESSDLASPADCTRRMLDETLQNEERRLHELAPLDSLGPRSLIGH
jgi:prepilin-type N-terminal cleavage/methylation domain-containing protein